METREPASPEAALRVGLLGSPEPCQKAAAVSNLSIDQVEPAQLRPAKQPPAICDSLELGRQISDA